MATNRHAHTYTRHSLAYMYVLMTSTTLDSHGHTQTGTNPLQTLTHTHVCINGGYHFRNAWTDKNRHTANQSRHSLVHTCIDTPYHFADARTDTNRHTHTPNTHSHTRVYYHRLPLQKCTDGHKKAHTDSIQTLTCTHVCSRPLPLRNARTDTNTPILTCIQVRADDPYHYANTWIATNWHAHTITRHSFAHTYVLTLATISKMHEWIQTGTHVCSHPLPLHRCTDERKQTHTPDTHLYKRVI